MGGLRPTEEERTGRGREVKSVLCLIGSQFKSGPIYKAVNPAV